MELSVDYVEHETTFIFSCDLKNGISFKVYFSLPFNLASFYVLPEIANSCFKKSQLQFICLYLYTTVLLNYPENFVIKLITPESPVLLISTVENILMDVTIIAAKRNFVRFKNIEN